MADDLPYRVSWSRKALEVLEEHKREGQPAGAGKRLAEAVRTLDERLRRQRFGSALIRRPR
jgi:hypothetical protein